MKQKGGTEEVEEFDSLNPKCYSPVGLVIPNWYDKDKEMLKKLCIDIEKPLVYQIFRQPQDNYIEMCKTVSTINESLRFFKNSFLEMCSRTFWFVIPSIWLPVVFYNIYHGAIGFAEMKDTHPFNSTARFVVGNFLLGVFLWSFVEYIIHRFFFHFKEEWLPGFGQFRVLHFVAHTTHHVFPFDKFRLVFPPALAMLAFLFARFLFLLILKAPCAKILYAGFIAGYIAYDMIHYHIHHSAVNEIAYLREMKRYHMKHHFRNSTMGYGVSSKIWDSVFDTTL